MMIIKASPLAPLQKRGGRIIDKLFFYFDGKLVLSNINTYFCGVKNKLVMANIKLQYVLGYAYAAKALLDANGTAVKTFEPLIGGTWEALVFGAQIAAMEGVVSVGGLEGLNKEDTILRNNYMRSLKPILRNLAYKVKACILAGTITDGYASFGIGAFLKSIYDRDINSFHLCFTTTMARINAGTNAAALNTAGFTTAKQTSIVTIHGEAWGVQVTKITVKENISDLSKANQVIVKALLRSCALIIKAVRGYAESISDTVLMGKATQKAVLATVTPGVPVGSVDRKVKENTSRCWLKNPVARDLMKFTLLTEGGEVYVCRMDLMTGVCSAGLLLVFGEVLEVKKMDVPGTGDKIIITNAGGGDVVVRTERVKG